MKTIDQPILVEVDEVKLICKTKTPVSQRAKVTHSKNGKAIRISDNRKYNTVGITMIYTALKC